MKLEVRIQILYSNSPQKNNSYEIKYYDVMGRNSENLESNKIYIKKTEFNSEKLMIVK